MYEEYKEKIYIRVSSISFTFSINISVWSFKTNKQTNKDIGQKQISSDIAVVINSKENINLKIQILKGCTL